MPTGPTILISWVRRKAFLFVWVRPTGGRIRSLIEEMRRYNQVSSFDEQPQLELNSEAIDFRVASELLPSSSSPFAS